MLISINAKSIIGYQGSLITLFSMGGSPYKPLDSFILLCKSIRSCSDSFRP